MFFFFCTLAFFIIGENTVYFYRELLLMNFKTVIKMRNKLLYRNYKNGFYYYCYISSFLLVIYSEDNQIQISSNDNSGMCERTGKRKGDREGKTGEKSV